MTATQTKPTAQAGPATIEDLYRVDGKAELVNGVIVEMEATGEDPGYAGDEIFMSRFETTSREEGRGRAVSDSKGFVVHLPNRQSFSPDAAYYIAERAGMRFVEGAPLFAVEVRSENDYGPAAEREMAAKRADYFAAGTLVVWDVDLLSETLSVFIEPMRRTALPSTAGAKLPRLNPPSPAGRCRWMTCSFRFSPASGSVRIPIAPIG